MAQPPPPQEEAAQPPITQKEETAASETKPTKPPLPEGQVQSKHPEMEYFITIVTLVSILLAGITVAVIWIPSLPKKLEYSVERASIRGYNLTAAGRLTANLSLVVRAVNPHRDGYSFYYQRVDATASYKDCELMSGHGIIRPFHQPKRNATELNLNLAARDLKVTNESVAGDLKMARGAGSLNLGVRIRAKMMLKLGGLKVIHRTLKVYCGPMKVPFSSNVFERVVCDTVMSG